MKKILIAFLLFIFTAVPSAFAADDPSSPKTSAAQTIRIEGTVSVDGTPQEGVVLVPKDISALVNTNTTVSAQDGHFIIEKFPVGHDLIAQFYSDSDATVSYNDISVNPKNVSVSINFNENIKSNLESSIVKADCLTESKQAELHATKGKNITTDINMNLADGDKSQHIICIPTECEYGYLLQNPDTQNAVCTPCTKITPYSTAAHVVDGACFADTCQKNFRTNNGKCVVDCNATDILNKLHATAAANKTGVVLPTVITRGVDFTKYCYPTACDTPRYEERGVGESKTCFDLNNQPCTPTDTAHAKTGKYDWRSNEKRLLCKPDCIGSNYAAKLNETKTDYYCALKKKPHKECTTKEIRDLKKSGKLDSHTTKGNVIAWEESSNVVTACSVEECERGWKPAKKNETDEYNTMCKSVAGDPCIPDDEFASAGAWVTARNGKLVCESTVCKYPKYHEPQANNSDVRVCTLIPNIKCEDITKFDVHATNGVVTKVNKDGIVTACKIKGCQGEYEPDKNGTKCEKPKCPCGQKWDDTKNGCTGWTNTDTDCTAEIKNAASAHYTCPNGPTGKKFCQLDKCKDTFKKDPKNTNACITQKGDTCETGEIDDGTGKGTYDIRDGKLVCKPICDGKNYTAIWHEENEWKDKTGKYQCDAIRAVSGGNCPKSQLRDQHLQAKSGEIKLRDKNGNIKKCEVKTCNDGWKPAKDPTENYDFDTICVIDENASCDSKDEFAQTAVWRNVNGKPVCQPTACKYEPLIKLDTSAAQHKCVVDTTQKCNDDVIKSLKDSNKIDVHAATGTVAKVDPKTGAVTACTVTGCEEDYKQDSKDKNKCVSKRGESCDVDVNIKYATRTGTLQPDGTGKLVCKPSNCTQNGYSVTLNNAKDKYICRHDSACTTSELKAQDPNASSGQGNAHFKDSEHIEFDWCELIACNAGWEPRKDGKSCRESKCQCNEEYSQATEKCIRWENENIGPECPVEHAAKGKSHYQCPNGLTGARVCIVEECESTIYKKNSTNTACILRENEPCKVSNFETLNTTSDGVLDLEHLGDDGQPICKPRACKYDTYIMQYNADKKSYECVLDQNKNRAVGTDCTFEEVQAQDPNAKTGTVQEWVETTGKVKSCIITGCINNTYEVDEEQNKCVSKGGKPCMVPDYVNRKTSETGTLDPQHTDQSGNPLCKPSECMYKTYILQLNSAQTAYICVLKENRMETLCNDAEIAELKDLKALDLHATKGTVSDWDETTGEIKACKITGCDENFVPNDAGTACEIDIKQGQKCPLDILQKQDSHATSGTVKKQNKNTGDIEECEVKTCADTWQPNKESNTEFEYSTKCVCADGFHADDETNPTMCISNNGQKCELNDMTGVAVATWHKNGKKMECLVDACKKNFNRSDDKKKCIAIATLSEADQAARQAELTENAQKMKDKENSLANRTIGAAGIGATGIGGTLLGAGISEQIADAAAEEKMRDYIATFSCDYGSGQVDGNTTENPLPPTPGMAALKQTYVTTAARLQKTKQALGKPAGIESEIIINNANTGLYDDVNTGVSSHYASVSDAILAPDSAGAEKWNEQQKTTTGTVVAGAVVAGVGAVGSAVANIKVNSDNKNQSKNILSEYESKKSTQNTIERASTSE